MTSFRGNRLAGLSLPQGVVWQLETLAEARGRQQLYEQQSPQILENLRELALVESAESSNRIEGVTVDRSRLRPLVLGDAIPRDRPEEEVVGYRRALNWIHAQHGEIPMTVETCLKLHALAQGGTSGDAGVWKSRPNDIVEIFADGRREVRFRPLPPEQVPSAMAELFLAYADAIEQRQLTPLLGLSALILDVLSIHPFRDGNGRVSRLLFLLGLYQLGFKVGRYISLERIIEQTKEDYYDTLKRSSQGWHEGHHDILPWFTYLLSTLRLAYREFEERAQRAKPERGSKTAQIEDCIQGMLGPFALADVERLCPNVGRELIRQVMTRLRQDGRLIVLSKGRDAKWRRVEGKWGR